MKLKFIAFALLGVMFSSIGYADYVDGYYRKNGTYVSGYNRSERNNTVQDNYSYVGNTNPYTGQSGSNYYRDDSSSAYYRGY